MLPNWKNAFRVLGLPADATAAEARAAARKMRLQAKLGPVSPSRDPLRSIARTPLTLSEADINAALSRLERPGSRCAEQIAWFSGGPIYDGLCAGKEPGREDKRADAVRFYYWKEAARFLKDSDWPAFAPHFARMTRMVSSPALLEETYRRNEKAGWLHSADEAGAAAMQFRQFGERWVLDELEEAVEKRALVRGGGCLAAIADAGFETKRIRAALHRILQPWEMQVRRSLEGLSNRWLTAYEQYLRPLWLAYFRAALVWELHDAGTLVDIWIQETIACCRRSMLLPNEVKVLCLIGADLDSLSLKSQSAENLRKLHELLAVFSSVAPVPPVPEPPGGTPFPTIRHESSLPAWRPPTPPPLAPPTQAKVAVIQAPMPISPAPLPITPAPPETPPVAPWVSAESDDFPVRTLRGGAMSMSVCLPLIYLFTFIVLSAASEVPPFGIFMALLLSFSVVMLMEANPQGEHHRFWVHAVPYFPPVALALHVSTLNETDITIVSGLLGAVYMAFMWQYIDLPKIRSEAEAKQYSWNFEFYRGLTVFFLGVYLLMGLLTDFPWEELGVVMMSFYVFIAFIYHDFFSVDISPSQSSQANAPVERPRTRSVKRPRTRPH
jgi:hypothetical protein